MFVCGFPSLRTVEAGTVTQAGLPVRNEIILFSCLFRFGRPKVAGGQGSVNRRWPRNRRRLPARWRSAESRAYRRNYFPFLT